MVADIPPWEQFADVIKAIGSVLSAVALPGAVAYAFFLFRDRIGGILQAVEERVRAGAKLHAEAGPLKADLGATAPPIAGEARVSAEAAAVSSRQLQEGATRQQLPPTSPE
jgi:hypothetical protein